MSTLLCTFTVDTLTFGVEVTSVQEVMREQVVTRVPLAAAEIAGLINLRGHIVTSIELRRVLGLAARAPETPPMNIVLRVGDDIVCLVVDAIGDVVAVDAACFERTPETIDSTVRAVVRGVYTQECLVLLLNTAAVSGVEVGARADSGRAQENAHASRVV